MRLAFLLPAALLATGCVPSVNFADGGGPLDATRDSPGLDVQGEADVDAESDAAMDGGDAADASDAGTDAPVYCKGDAGAPGGFTCCGGGGGIVCSGNCNAMGCLKCGACNWPSVCCTSGSTGTCSPDGGC